MIGSSTSYGGSESESFWSGRSSADGGFSITVRGITSRPDALVEVVTERVDERLRDVLDDREAAGHVAVERGVARWPSRSCCRS